MLELLAERWQGSIKKNNDDNNDNIDNNNNNNNDNVNTGKGSLHVYSIV